MSNISLTVKIERAISELRRGGKLVISDNNTGQSVLLTASELIHDGTINELSSLALSRPNIILSKNRCRALGIRDAEEPCSILINSDKEIEITLNKIYSITKYLKFINIFN